MLIIVVVAGAVRHSATHTCDVNTESKQQNGFSLLDPILNLGLYFVFSTFKKILIKLISLYFMGSQWIGS